MTVEREPAPEGWKEQKEVPLVMEKYRGRDPTIFEHDGGDVAVQVVPAEPNEAHGDIHDWRIDVVTGGPEEPTHVEAVEELQGRPDALSRAREVMGELNEEGVEGTAEELAEAVR